MPSPGLPLEFHLGPPMEFRPELLATSRAAVGCGHEGTGNAPAQTVARASGLLRCRNVGCVMAPAKLAGAFPVPSRSTFVAVRLGLTA